LNIRGKFGIIKTATAAACCLGPVLECRNRGSRCLSIENVKLSNQKSVVCFPMPVRRSYLRAYKAPFYVSFCTFYASLRLTRTVFTRLQIKFRRRACPERSRRGLHNFAFYILIFAFSLTSYGINSTKEQVRKNKLFLQNKAKFRKVKLNVTKVMIKDYDQLDTWSIRTTKPIKANKSQ
jgi:hypothetical protein